MISYGISMIINYKYGILGNIKGGIWMTFQFFLLYCISEDDDIQKIKHEFKIVSCVLIGYTALCSFLGIVMMSMQFGGRFNFADGTGSFYGFIWGRLWGCYTDPNHGAVITAAAIIAAIYLMFNVEKIYQKVLIGSSIVLNYLYIVFSDSRSSKISFSLAVCVVLFLAMIAQVKNLSGKKYVFRGVFVILITVLIYFSFSGIKNGYNYCIKKSVEREIMNEVTEEKVIIEKEKVDSLKIGREQDIQEDFSNRRFDIWKSGLQIFNDNKLVGISFRNILPYTKANLPETYIVNNDHGEFDSFHNVVVDVLVSQGIFGIAVIVVMGIVFGIYWFKQLVLKKRCQVMEVKITFGLTILLLADSMFISEIFYVNSPETVLFWMLLGYLMYFIRKNDNNEEVEENVRN